jgi:hypothetical protein
VAVASRDERGAQPLRLGGSTDNLVGPLATSSVEPAVEEVGRQSSSADW